MKLYELPINTLVELQFYYMNDRHMISSGLLYRYADTVYVTAVKSAGETLSAKKLKEFSLIYKSEAAIYSFSDIKPRSVSYCGQNLYAIQTDQDAKLVDHRNAYRLFIGAKITAKLTSNGKTKQMDCILKDISMTGMGIVSMSKLDEMTKIEISFSVNDNTHEILVASIVHSRQFRSGNGYLYGCEFDVPNVIIGNYVARRQEQLKRNTE